MEPFLLYSIIISAFAFLTLLWIFISIAAAYQTKAKLKPVKYLTYNRQYFNRDFEFTCEYCNTKLNGRSIDEKTCPNCGARYCDNVGLLVAEEEEKVEKTHYQEYLTLKDIEWNMNIDNIHDKKDAFYTKHAKGFALLGIFIMFAIAFVIVKLIL